ncbi:Cysteine-rich receptor-like protein kinase 5 [Dichanthelium oligosanthes]|uniref:Cysteine-rich receptor-like protein kinase 5 n=1 Tax=Dichanthelium oligosanthes TaxID=888268 RepID=A0A1E5V395_9POAL|nr:Cysteine-rich receptor-like protein kinase 5 [Dichanthelium oligosanthes]
MASARLAAALFFLLALGARAADVGEVQALLALGAALDPTGRLLPSWVPGRNPCAPEAGGGFEGVACDARGAVANVSLQGKGLAGTLPPAVAGLRALTGLYLHYNALRGGIPREVASLADLTDLYLDVNSFSGTIPPEIGAMPSLQVLQLCYNQLTGSIPTQLGNLTRLTVLALQSNRLNGAIPASLGDLPLLARLDLSFNNLFGSIPVRLAQLPRLVALDVTNNSLTGSVPAELAAKLQAGFQYGNNTDLCGAGLPALRPCTRADLINPDRPQPFSAGIAPQVTPSDGGGGHGRAPSTKALAALVVVAVALLAATVVGLFALSWHRWRTQRVAGGSPSTIAGGRCSTEAAPSAAKASSARKSASSALASLEYSNAWDPLADARGGAAGLGFSSQDVLAQSLRITTEEVESATRYFSDLNLLGRRGKKAGGLAATYRGTLRDGTPVAVKRLGKTCCRQEEAEFLRGLKLLAELRHDNVVALRGFCCSRARGECFLVYDFVPNGSLSQFLDVDADSAAGGGGYRVLEWPTRISIIKGIARGIEYLHSTRPSKPALVHQNISADKVLLDYTYRPLISGCGLHKLLVDDLVFSTLKASAAMGYLAPEYTTVGRFSEKSDVYAFGVIVLQVLTGKRKVSTTTTQLPDGDVEELVDGNLQGSYSATEAAKLAKIALACTSENPGQRPTMEELLQELGTI